MNVRVHAHVTVRVHVREIGVTAVGLTGGHAEKPASATPLSGVGARVSCVPQVHQLSCLEFRNSQQKHQYV